MTVAASVRILLSEQAFGSVGLLAVVGMINDQMVILNVIVVLASIAGLATAVLTFRPDNVARPITFAVILIVIASFMDADASNLTRPSSFYISQALIGFASLLFLAQAMVIGIARTLLAGGRNFISFIVLFSISQSMGGLVGNALLGTFQVMREKFHLARAGPAHRADGSAGRRAAAVRARGAVAGVVGDPALRSAQGTAILAQQVAREANILAYNDVFLLVGRARGSSSRFGASRSAGRSGGGVKVAGRPALAASDAEGAGATGSNEMSDTKGGSRTAPAQHRLDHRACGGPARSAPAPTRPCPKRPRALAPPGKTRPTIIVIVAVAVLAILAILYAWRLPPFAGWAEKTDNAYVRGRVTIISPQVSGYVDQVPVQDFAEVRRGQVLATIDDRIYRARVAQAEASRRRAGGSARQFQRRRSARARSPPAARMPASPMPARQLDRAGADMRRAPSALVADGSISTRELDQTRAALLAARGRRAPGPAQAARSARRTCAPWSSGAAGSKPSRRGGEARSFALRRSTSTTPIIRAPADGQLSEIGVRSGAYVTAGTQLLFLVPHNVWVIANFKGSADRRHGDRPARASSVDALGRRGADRTSRESVARRGIRIRGAEGRQRHRKFRQGGAAHRGADPRSTPISRRRKGCVRACRSRSSIDTAADRHGEDIAPRAGCSHGGRRSPLAPAGGRDDRSAARHPPVAWRADAGPDRAAATRSGGARSATRR